MTAHELARKLLEGPDFYVVYDMADGWYGDYQETKLATIDTVELLKVWQVDYGHGQGWEGPLEEKPRDEPRNEKRKVREGEVVRLK